MLKSLDWSLDFHNAKGMLKSPRKSAFMDWRFHHILLFCALLCTEVIANEIQPEILFTRIDGIPHDPKGTRVLSIPNSAKDLELNFGTQKDLQGGARLRYQLQGVDPEWRDVPGQMRVVLHFLDARGLMVGASFTCISGTSKGWNGKIESSTFNERVVETTAPSRTHHIALEFVSGGSENTLGTFALRGLKVEMQTADRQVRHLNLSISRENNQTGPPGTPNGWLRGGSNPEMAVVFAHPLFTEDYALALRDIDPRTYASWRSAPKQDIRALPGDLVRVRWQECYSIGAGGPATAKYRSLRPGYYLFRTLCVSPFGELLGPSTDVPIVVNPPVWMEPWLWVFSLGMITGLASLCVRQATKKRTRLQMAELDRQRALEKERARIAHDIHDDLGSGLAQIAMLSELIIDDTPEDPDWRTRLEEISARARTAGRNLDEIVWAINPDYDSAEDLIGYLSRFAQDYLSLAKIRFRIEASPNLGHLPLSAVERHHLFLASKEALHNAVKHGGPEEVTLRAEMEHNALRIIIRDNGCGFKDVAPSSFTRGSSGMLRRLTEIGGTFLRETSQGNGTTITLSLPTSTLDTRHE